MALDFAPIYALAVTYFALLGGVVGSFLNVVIARLPEGQSVVRPRSRCPKCGASIAWYDNVPVLSYALLRGKCRSCKTPISLRYPLIELLMAALAAALFTQMGLSWSLLLWFPLSAALLAITFLDIDHWWVPDVITYPALAFALACSFLPGDLSPLEALLGLIPALILWGTAWVFEKVTKREGLGFGDVKLLAVMGAALGLMGALSALFFAALQGAIIGSLVVALGGHKSEAKPLEPGDDWQPHPRAVPFGPFLALATFEVVLLPGVFADLPARLSASLAQLVT